MASLGVNVPTPVPAGASLRRFAGVALAVLVTSMASRPTPASRAVMVTITGSRAPDTPYLIAFSTTG